VGEERLRPNRPDPSTAFPGPRSSVRWHSSTHNSYPWVEGAPPDTPLHPFPEGLPPGQPPRAPPLRHRPAECTRAHQTLHMRTHTCWHSTTTFALSAATPPYGCQTGSSTAQPAPSDSPKPHANAACSGTPPLQRMRLPCSLGCPAERSQSRLLAA
jgi:hypothetical protein